VAVIKSGAGTTQASVGTTSLGLLAELVGNDGVSLKGKKTYFASGSFTPPATPTDLVGIFGSATKTIRVLSMKIGTANTAAGSQILFLSKRSAVSTGTAWTAATVGKADSTDADATGTPGHIITTANVAGAGVTINTKKIGSPAVTPATWAGINTTDNDVEMLPTTGDAAKPITLRGVAEGLVINFAGTALVAGQIHTYNICWTEE
jgi:hypothetical protein